MVTASEENNGPRYAKWPVELFEASRSICQNRSSDPIAQPLFFRGLVELLQFLDPNTNIIVVFAGEIAENELSMERRSTLM
jgi:hypothetical protein